jgi:sarcosine/dimethylglycine N-methyltransferase
MSTREIAEAAARYRATFDTDQAALQSRMWEGNQHLGLFERGDEPLAEAQMAANRRMAAAAGLAPGQVVVEAACGFGGTARHLAREHGVRVRATNISETQIVDARALTEAEGLADRVDFGWADYHELPFADGSFDVWWCQEALLYAVDKRRVLEEAMRVLKPGGRLIMSDLLLAERVAGAARERFTATMKAPNMWSLERWDALIASLPLAVIERQDWSAHTRPTFERVHANLEAAEAEFLPRLGAEAMAGSFERIGIQRDAARAGELGWCFYALRR